MSDERIHKLERIADKHDRDLALIASSIEKLVVQSEKTNEMIHQALLRDERFDAKLLRCESMLASKIEHVHETSIRAHTRLDKFDKFIWLIVSFVTLGVLGSVISFKGGL